MMMNAADVTNRELFKMVFPLGIDTDTTSRYDAALDVLRHDDNGFIDMALEIILTAAAHAANRIRETFLEVLETVARWLGDDTPVSAS